MYSIVLPGLIVSEVTPEPAICEIGYIIIQSSKRPFGRYYQYPISPASRDRLRRLVNEREKESVPF